MEGSTDYSGTSSIFSISSLLMLIYLAGMIYSLLKLIYGLIKIFKILDPATIKKMDDHILVKNENIQSPFSFFKYLFTSSKMLSKQDWSAIREHELVHIRQWHSADVLLIEILKVIFWFNPILWFYKKEIGQNHEYLADRNGLKFISKKNYSHLLINMISTAPYAEQVNNFNYSPIKKRIKMIYKENSGKERKIKYLLFIPVFAILFFFISCSDSKIVNDDKVEEIKTEFSDPKVKSETETSEVKTTTYGVFDESGNVEDVVVKGNEPAPKPPYKYIKSTDSKGDTYMVIDDMPLFPGCDAFAGNLAERKKCSNQKMLEFIYKDLKYPEAAKEKGVEGTVVAQFVVDATGNVSEIEIIREIGEGCDEAVISVLENMNKMEQKWTPGKEDGKAVKVMFTLPVKFKLS